VGPEDRQFPEFFTSQYGRLRRLGFLLTGDWGEGEELAQETLVRIYWRWSLVRRVRSCWWSGRPSAGSRPAPPPVPVSAAGVVRRERQGFELTLPEGWKVDQSTTRSSYQFGQPWLVISPTGRPSATDARRMTIYTTVTPPSEYPGKPVKGKDNLGGQSFSTLSGRRSSGRRPDGRAFTAGDQGGILSYHIAWPYRCEPADLCPEAGPGGCCGWTSREPAGRRG
jgi:hypothetical protein